MVLKLLYRNECLKNKKDKFSSKSKSVLLKNSGLVNIESMLWIVVNSVKKVKSFYHLFCIWFFFKNIIIEIFLLLFFFKCSIVWNDWNIFLIILIWFLLLVCLKLNRVKFVFLYAYFSSVIYYILSFIYGLKKLNVDRDSIDTAMLWITSDSIPLSNP